MTSASQHSLASSMVGGGTMMQTSSMLDIPVAKKLKGITKIEKVSAHVKNSQFIDGKGSNKTYFVRPKKNAHIFLSPFQQSSVSKRKQAMMF